MSKIIFRLRDSIENWFASTEPGIAGTLGVYRILYGISILWVLSLMNFNAFTDRPYPPTDPVGIFLLLQYIPLSSSHFVFMVQMVLPFSLVLLTFGLATRFSSIVVMIIAILLVTWDSSYGKVIDKYVLLCAIIPFFMSFSKWGETYSLDRAIRQHRGLRATDPRNSSWEYAWPQKAVLIFMCIFYFSAGFEKIAGTWLENPYVLSDLISGKALSNFAVGKGSNVPLGARLLLQYPFLMILFQYAGLLFELCFPLALINRDYRNILLSSAVLFHTSTMITTGIAFAPMIMSLALFVNWQSILHQLGTKHGVMKISKAGTFLLVFLVTLLAVIAALVMQSPKTTELSKSLPSWEKLWYIIVPFALFSIIVSVRELLTSRQV